MNFTKDELFLLSDSLLKVMEMLDQSAKNIASMGISCKEYDEKRKEMVALLNKMCDYTEGFV